MTDLCISLKRPEHKFNGDCFKTWCTLNQLTYGEGLAALVHLIVNEPEAAAILRRFGLKPLTRKHLEAIATRIPQSSSGECVSILPTM